MSLICRLSLIILSSLIWVLKFLTNGHKKEHIQNKVWVRVHALSRDTQKMSLFVLVKV